MEVLTSAAVYSVLAVAAAAAVAAVTAAVATHCVCSQSLIFLRVKRGKGKKMKPPKIYLTFESNPGVSEEVVKPK